MNTFRYTRNSRRKDFFVKWRDKEINILSQLNGMDEKKLREKAHKEKKMAMKSKQFGQ
jgi:VIT1/CCC1 family predicted Fe2+/Mn2+ transporter